MASPGQASGSDPAVALPAKAPLRFSEWLPKSFLVLSDYNLKTFSSDLIAGVTVGLVALPLAMAFAISSGVPPQAGIYTAIVAGFFISALGGSRVQIGGPTGAFVVIVYGIIAKYDLIGLLMCTFMAGIMLLVMGATGLGTAVKFIPRPVVVGFTNGIAVLIASTQIKDFFGLKVENVPGEFVARMKVLAASLPTFSVAETSLATISLVLILVFARYVKRIPGYIIALVVGTALVAILRLPVETIGTRFGGIPSGLPRVEIPVFHFDKMLHLIQPALTVAMLGAIESLMSAVVADRMTGDKHNPNVELMAQGIANILSPLVGGLPATGAIARTATNVRSGGKTPIAGIVHALVLLAILLFAAPLAKFIPLCVLAAILLVVSYNMGEWREIPHLLRLSKMEIAVWVITFGLTVFADLTVAVEFGMVMAALVFIRNVTRTTTVSEVTEDYLERGRVHILQDKDIPPYVTIFRIHGPFLFGATEKVDEIFARLHDLPPIVVLRLRNMTALDATGLHALEDVAVRVRESGRALILCGAPPQPRALMKQSVFQDHVGADNICDNVEHALIRAKQTLPSVADNNPHVHWKKRKSDQPVAAEAFVDRRAPRT
ncbi:MAG TPA: sulfate permease [Terriglobales bacterium]|nr:sulfate permease [Terriglobales bacterium]